MTKDKSRIQSCVDHINTAIDVDPWAKELVAEMGKEILKAQLSGEDATSDCISRADAIDAAKHAWAKGLEPSQYIEELPPVQPERKTGKWIPCSDKIPSEAQECWITAKDGTVCQGMFTRQYGERRDSGFICNNGFAWLNTVVAWMPYDMPEPWEEGEQE